MKFDFEIRILSYKILSCICSFLKKILIFLDKRILLCSHKYKIMYDNNHIFCHPCHFKDGVQCLNDDKLHNSLTRLLEGESTLVHRMLDSLSSSSSFSVEYSLLSSDSSMSSSSSSSSLSLSSSSSSSREDMSTENDSIKDQEQSFLRLTIEATTSQHCLSTISRSFC